MTGNVLHATLGAFVEHGVSLEGMLLKPNMVIAAQQCPQQTSVEEVARATPAQAAQRGPAPVR